MDPPETTPPLVISETEPFTKVWSEKIFPVIALDFARLQNATPLRERERFAKRQAKEAKKEEGRGGGGGEEDKKEEGRGGG